MEDKEIREVVENCKWRHEVGNGFYLCRGMCSACLKIIGSGECDTLKKYFEERSKDK